MLLVLLVAYAYHTYQVERARRRIDQVALAAYDAAYAAYSALETERRKAEQVAREGERRRIREQEAWWASLDGNAFERELTALFRARGLDVRRTGGSGDGGIDLEVRSGLKRIIVQCKAHKSWLSPGPVRDLYGTLIHVSADEAWLVTTSGFYSGARAFAAGKPIRLYTIRQFLADPSFPPDA
jgi:HJR/Mrr/RecB family endonuclease